MFANSSAFLSILNELPEPSVEHSELARKRQAVLTKPPGALGRLEDIAIWLAGWQSRECPEVRDVAALLFAGNHGVVEEGVSPFPAAVTGQMVMNFEAGGAAINALTRQFGHELSVTAIKLDEPTKNFTHGAAMSEDEVLEAINIGAKTVQASQGDIVYFGEMGIGNTTVAATLAAQVFGGDGALWAGPGTGLDQSGVRHKALVIDRALKFHKAALADNFGNNPIEIMRRLGGRELAAIMGGVVAARVLRRPVVLDGFVVSAAVAPLVQANKQIFHHCIAGHCSAEPGHVLLLKRMGLQPLLELDMRLGEGTGAALAVELIKGAVATHNHMATFAEAGVTGS